MARKKGSKDKGKRASARDPYDTYSDWYDRYTKGEKAGWFSPKYSREEFEAEYEKARRAGVPNPARSVAAAQELVSREFEREFRKYWGHGMGDIRDPEQRQQLFWDFAEMYGDTEQARREFEEIFY